MKKNLLTLFTLFLMYNNTYAQTNTYINDAVVVKVNPNTLFYNGGSVAVATTANSSTTEKIINEGNIQVVGGFTNQNNTGKNFLNKYNSDSSYGQLIITNATAVTGKVAIEKNKPDAITNDEYVIALPFKNTTAENAINSLTGGTNLFSGECAINVDCGLSKRYDQTLFVWDNHETEYDAVQNNTMITPGVRYLMRFKNSNNTSANTFANAIQATTGNFKLAAIPNNDAVTLILKSGLKGNSQDYKAATWSAWKNLKNNYNEGYLTYLGNNTGTTYDANPIFGKNLHRLANPFTSNLDLSDVSTANTWIKFKLTADSDYTTSPTQGFNSIRFRVFKLANNFTIKTSSSGNITTKTTPISAYLYPNGSGQYFWLGNPDALLVKPYETFHIDYYQFSRANNNAGFVTDARVILGDNQKTFITSYAGKPNLSSDGIPGLFSRSSINTNSQLENDLQKLLSDEKLKAKGLVTDFDFTQLELFLSDTQDNLLQGNATYLANANFMATGQTTAPSNKITVNNPVYFLEETNQGDVYDYQTVSNQFNSEDYIGKPLHVGFNDLEEGKEYRLNLNLYEYSILNKVDKLNLGKYFILDKSTNKVSEVDGNTEVIFTADGNENSRFEFYWNESPKTLSTDDLTNNNTTYLYTNNGNQFIKFEQKNTTANINIYDLTGRQIFNKSAVVTNQDFMLSFSNIPSVYVVKITYKDGKTVTKKTIKK